MDGILNPLTFELQCWDASDYSGSQHGYSLSTHAVNDDKLRIMYYLAGWPGSTHDNHIFKNVHIFQDFNSYSCEHEYLLGDLAFECFPFVIGTYIQAGGQAIDCEEQIFNDGRIPSTTPGAEPPRDAKDSGSARSHSTHLETSSSDRP